MSEHSRTTTTTTTMSIEEAELVFSAGKTLKTFRGKAFLKKKRNGKNSWADRFAVLEGSVLLCYESKEANETQPKEVIPLVGATVTSDEETITITTKQQNTIKLQGKFVENTKEWFNALSAATLVTCQRVGWAFEESTRALVPENVVSGQTHQQQQQLSEVDRLREELEILKKVHNRVLELYISTVNTNNNATAEAVPQVDVDGSGEGDEQGIVSTNAFNLTRALVSQNKRRLQDKEYDLDLTYITEKLIAMSMPANGLTATYRNPYSKVLNYLDRTHRDKYIVLNLCSEIDRDETKFHGRWVRFPFDDHTPPPLRLARRACEYVQDWFVENEGGVVGVHCRAGKGRTGTIISMLLLSENPELEPEEVMKQFSAKRLVDGERKQAIRNPGQRRYVRYYSRLLRGGFPVKSLVELKSVSFRPLPFVRDLAPYLRVITNQYDKQIEQQFDTRDLPVELQMTDKEIKFQLNTTTEGGDVRIELFDQNSYLSDKLICRVFFHTSYEQSPVSFTKFEVDEAYSDKKHKLFPEDFVVEVEFDQLGDGGQKR